MLATESIWRCALDKVFNLDLKTQSKLHSLWILLSDFPAEFLLILSDRKFAV